MSTDKQSAEFKEKHRERLALEAQQDELCAQAKRLYEDIRVVERGIAEVETKLQNL